MINKVIKKAFLILIIYMVIISTSNVYGYDIKVTKDNLQKAFNEYAKGYSGGYVGADGTPGMVSFGESKAIEVTDKQLIDSNDSNNVYKVDYSLDGDLTFSTKIIFNKDSDLGIVSNMDEMLEAPLLGLIGTSIVQGAGLGEVYRFHSYAEKECTPTVEANSFSIMNLNNTLAIQINEDKKEFKQDDFKPSEIINFIFENKTIKDEEYGIYTYTFTINETSTENFELEAVLEIKKDADFSKVVNMNGTEESEDTNNNTVTNKVSNTSTTNKVSNSNLNTNKAAGAYVNTSNTSTNKIPNTGIDHTVIYILVSVLVIALVFFIKFEKINKDMK